MPCWTKVCDTCVCEKSENLGKKEMSLTENFYGISLEQCEQRCIDTIGCNAVEYRAGTSFCFKCIDPSQHHSHEDKTDKGYPSSVHQRGILYCCYRLCNPSYKKIGNSSFHLFFDIDSFFRFQSIAVNCIHHGEIGTIARNNAGLEIRPEREVSKLWKELTVVVT